MKKRMIKNLMLVVVMVVLCVAIGMTANAETWGDYRYIVLEDGTISIDDYYMGESIVTELEIPSEINGNIVTAIGQYAFAECSSLTSITIPNTVTTIGEGAFIRCLSLKELYFSENIIDIGSVAFIDCVNLEKIMVDENNSVYSSDEHGVLFNEDKTELILYPSGNKSAEYIIPDTVHTIKSSAFFDVFDLEKIEFPNSLKKIEEQSLNYMFRLKELRIPASVEAIDDVAIINCDFADVTIKSMDAQFGKYSLNVSDFYVDGIAQDDFADLYEQALRYGNKEAMNEVAQYIVAAERRTHLSTIYAHSGSTAEAYAIENGVDYELTHFFEGEWTYDYDNMIRYRKCIHCDELEIEALETTESGDVEIIEPTNPDTDFTVDVIEDYVVIEETISNNITADFEIVKAFDINLKNKDGVHVQPDGTVKVKLPLDWSKDGVYKVYRVNDNGTLTDMNAYREGSHMVFDTDHFSIYVIVDESEKTDAPATPDEPQEETKDNFFSKIIDLIKAFFDLIASMFKR